jgi:hypothetical protein
MASTIPSFSSPVSSSLLPFLSTSGGWTERVSAGTEGTLRENASVYILVTSFSGGVRYLRTTMQSWRLAVARANAEVGAAE